MSQYSPFQPLRLPLDLSRQIEHAFSELIHEPWGRGPGERGWHPAVDLYETDDEYLVEADIPGVRPEQVEVRIEGKTLTLCGARDTVTFSGSPAGRTLMIERSSGRFCRTLELAQPVDAGRVETHFEQGILRVRLPKMKRASGPERK